MIALLGIPLVILLVIIQTSVISRLDISYGMIDLVLVTLIAIGIHPRSKHIVYWFLLAGFLLAIISPVRLMYPLFPYAVTGILVEYLRKRIWRIPLLLMAILTFLGSIMQQLAAYITIYFTQAQLPFMDSLLQVSLPSITLNILVSIPAYLVIKDWGDTLSPQEVE